MRRLRLLVCVIALLPACESRNVVGPGASAPAGSPAPEDTVLAAGDIADCANSGDAATEALLGQLPGTILTLGDNAYPLGLPDEFSRCYAPTWGLQLARTHPVPGNHDYSTPGALGYYAYFGAAAGPPLKGYYSFDVGSWHIVALNSEIDHSAGSDQERWLRADLAAHPALCTLAYMHRPRFSSGIEHGSDGAMQPLWQALYDGGADVALAGHDHDYERFAPLRPDGTADPARGLREFVVGTGGEGLRSFRQPVSGSQVRDAGSLGVLRLALDAAGYHWDFLGVDGDVRDSGSARCH